MKQITILVAADGSSTIETTGFTGAQCQQASEFLEEALGERQSHRLKPEYYQPVANQQSQQARQS
ncbi:DUF2997 domain-containing protein [Rhodopirellula sallentina]|uniref:DUF2997 domain-containing protein n=1 Tax=Rhodopirellula sallentina SM41 TaxID=1263870 RepID=M5U6F7_9BACT|nr:DUF2997 domain-containing protein [Rhodopirellula sallentina]EMI57052.1 hypothetical protein RSSM_01462 [Rhodopirellula sallentina SM41]